MFFFMLASMSMTASEAPPARAISQWPMRKALQQLRGLSVIPLHTCCCHSTRFLCVPEPDAL